MTPSDAQGGRVGPKAAVTGERAVCSSQHPIVTDTMLATLRAGGNAIDAGIAGCLVQATVQQEMTNHAGTVTCLYYEASSGRVHELNGMGVILPDLAPFRQIPPDRGHLAGVGGGPFAVVPGFMPAMKALHERFATRPWAELCEPAIAWAEAGHVVGSFEHRCLVEMVDLYLYTASGRAHFTPAGHLPQVGDRWPKPELALTLRRLAAEGPDEFMSGGWARQLVERAQQLGWPLQLAHLSQHPPRWGEGLRFRHGEDEVVQLSPPERQGVFCAIVLGMLDELGVTRLGPYAESADACYALAHALRRAALETGALNDPATFDDPSPLLLERSAHRLFAEVVRRSRPRVDLTTHVRLTAGATALAAGGATPPQPTGSCEMSVVDPGGNWLQLMTTLQSGGIPGEVVGGVPMVGSHARTSLAAYIAGWFSGGGRMRSVIGNTLVLREGRPWLALGTPGNVYATIPQVLSSILDHGMEPPAAEAAPLMDPLTDEYVLRVESRLPPAVVDGLAALGVLVSPLPQYDWNMGSFQMSWRGADGRLHGSAGVRRAGSAAAW